MIKKLRKGRITANYRKKGLKGETIMIKRLSDEFLIKTGSGAKIMK
ncbi:hypothetical protein [Peribacillus butanolivorans]